nr:tyrosine-type recombinase/integrase [Ferrimicrobium acidiphilum]
MRWSQKNRSYSCAPQRKPSYRGTAIGLLGVYSGLRVAEIAALNVEDVVLSAKRGQVVVWHGKGDRHRELPLHPEARSALSEWLGERW